jgi:hypothetical protein
LATATDFRGVDLISDSPPFGCLWYREWTLPSFFSFIDYGDVSL